MGNYSRIRLLDGVGLTTDEIERIAFETGFCKRASGKISAPNFLLHLCLESLEGTVSYNDLAARIEVETGVSASRQAYWERTNDPCVVFFQRVLEHVLRDKFRDNKNVCPSAKFNRVLLQDSTVIQLPLRLFETFSGVRNAHTAVCNARIQGVYDLVSGRFVKFSIDSYSKNDLLAALDLPLEPGDLVLRDRGYFSPEILENQMNAEAHTIYRYKHKTSIFDPDTGEEINLLQLLSQQGCVDKVVLVDCKRKLRVRLVAAKVNEETANLRRMKAKQQTNGHAPSQELLMLLSWTIFITTLTDPEIKFNDLLDLYGLRWRIENIFKTWKSNFCFAKVHNVSKCQLRVLLTARLVMITIFYQNIYVPLSLTARHESQRQLSLMKLMRYISQNLEILPNLLNPLGLNAQMLKTIIRYCAYEKRNRVNFIDKMEKIAAAILCQKELA
jgi:hypothetical protein